jgi:four helix bundle protein
MKTCAWQKAMDFTVDLYKVTQKFPREEAHGLVTQLRRAAVSIASTIAEGKGTFSDKELLHFLSNARGSVYETQTQIALAHRLNLLTLEENQPLVNEGAELDVF